MPGIRVDGNDVLACVNATREAFKRAPLGGGPTLIELVTYRRGGHSSSDDPTRYRDESKVPAWLLVDPITRFRDHLAKLGLIDDAKEAAMRGEIKDSIDAAVREAEPAAHVAVDTLFTDVYGHPPATLRAQRAEVIGDGSGTAEGAFPPTLTLKACVIGAGPGGYVAAIRLARMGVETVIVEREALGGVCLNWGCIPSKAYIGAAKLYDKIKTADELRITTKDLQVDLAKMQAWKSDVVKKSTGGIGDLLKRNGCRILMGDARFTSAYTLEVTGGKDGTVIVKAEHFIVATGLRPFDLPTFPVDGKHIITSTEALDSRRFRRALGPRRRRYRLSKSVRTSRSSARRSRSSNCPTNSCREPIRILSTWSPCNLKKKTAFAIHLKTKARSPPP
jgi:hypothetical protein